MCILTVFSIFNNNNNILTNQMSKQRQTTHTTRLLPLQPAPAKVHEEKFTDNPVQRILQARLTT